MGLGMIEKGRQDPRDDGDSLDAKDLIEEIYGTRDDRQRQRGSKG